MRASTADAYQLLHDGALALARMEANGVCIDVDYLDRALRRATRKIEEMESRLRADPIFLTWKNTFRDRTKLGSLPQLTCVLFKVMQVPYDTERWGLTETGRFRGDEKILSTLDIPFVQDYLKYGDLRKDKSTYLDGIKRELVNGRIHGFFNLHTARTYRSSSDRPSMHTFPRRDEDRGKFVRRCLIPSPGNHLVEVDFQSAEVRVGAAYHQDHRFIEEFTQPGKDPHRDTAIQLYQFTRAEWDSLDKGVAKMARHCAKNLFVFRQFYGGAYFQAAPQLWDAIDRSNPKLTLPDGRSFSDHLSSRGVKKLGPCNPKNQPEKGTFEYAVREVERDFWSRRFQVYGKWRKDEWEKYLRTGEVHYKTGFVIHGLMSRNDVYSYAIQGSSFHCLLWTIIEVQRELDRRKMRTKLVSQIHDSLIADVPPDELQEYLTLVNEIITVKLSEAWTWLIVPMVAEMEVTPVDGSWAEKVPYTLQDGYWAPKEN